MKNGFKRVMAAMLSLIMVLSLAACGEKVDPTDAPTDAPKATEADKQTDAPQETEAAEFDPKTITDGVTLTIAVKADDEVIDWETNLVTKMIEEKFGVDLKFEVYASDGFGDKLNVMINGGDKLPDIIFGDGTKGLDSYQANWVDAGAILELNGFYANPDYASHINAEMEKLGVDVVSLLEDADGKIWSLPKYATGLNDACAYKLWINKDYAKAVGFDEIPTTTEGFFELCKAFAAAGDVNGNGLDDELAFTGQTNLTWFKYLMSPFAYAWDDKTLDVENGKVSFAFATDGWKEGLKYIKQFFDEGIIDTTVLTQDKAGYNAIVNNSEAVVLADVFYRPQMVHEDVTQKTQIWLEYDFVEALKGPNGRVEAYYSDIIAYPGAMITADCEHPEAAFIVLDYMCSEYISICNRYGEEGVDWDYWENVDNSKFTDGSTKEMYLARNGEEPLFVAYTLNTYWGTGTPQNAGYMQAGPNILYSDESGLVLTGATSDEAKVQQDWMNLYQKESVNAVDDAKPEERIVRLPLTAEENEAIAEPYKVISSYWKEAVGNFLTGEWDIDGYWDTYLAELEKMGMSDVLAIYQTSYDRTK